MIGIAICDDHTDYDVGNEIINTILNYYLSPIKSACKITVRRKNEPFAENRDNQSSLGFANLF